MANLDVDETELFLMLRRDEGERGRPYDDATGSTIKAPHGNVTLGIGHNTDANPLSPAAMAYICREDALEAQAVARRLVGVDTWAKMGPRRRLALINLAFTMGERRLSGFTEMLKAVREGNWFRAGFELQRSKWWTQVDPRQIPNQGRDDRVFFLLTKEEFRY